MFFLGLDDSLLQEATDGREEKGNATSKLRGVIHGIHRKNFLETLRAI